jgi:hypothetical protein
MRKLLVLIYSPVSCFVTAIFVISKEMIQNSERTSPDSITDPPFTETNDRLFEIAVESVPVTNRDTRSSGEIGLGQTALCGAIGGFVAP